MPAELPEWVPIVLFLLGFAFMIAEVFFPSFGILGLLSAVCLIGGLALAFTASTSYGVVSLITVVGLIPVVLIVAFKVLPHTPVGRSLVLSAPKFCEDDPHGADPRIRQYLGKQGVTLSLLRPSGVAEIEGKRVDVVTRGEVIEKGRRIQVIHVEGNRVVVEASPDGEADAGPSSEAGNA